MYKRLEFPDLLTALLQYSEELVCLIDKEGFYRYTNELQNATLGWSIDELLGTNISQYIHTDDLEKFNEILELARSGKSSTFEPCRFKNNKLKWVWLKGNIINLLDIENVNSFLIRATQVTINSLEEDQRNEGLIYYNALFNNNPEAIAQVGLNGVIEEVNNKTIALLGVPKKEIVGTHFLGLFARESSSEVFKAFLKASSGDETSSQSKILNTAGNLLHVTLSFIPVIAKEKVLNVQVIARDVTEIFQVQEKVNNLDKIQGAIVNSKNEGFFVLDNNWCFKFINNIGADFFGTSIEALLNKPVISFYPAQSLTLFLAKCLEVMQGLEATSFQETFPETEVTYEFKIHPVQDGLIILFTDITSKIASQAGFEKLSMVVNSIASGVLLLDAEGRITWVNDGFLTITGFTQEELNGKLLKSLTKTYKENSELVTERHNKILKGISYVEDLLIETKFGNHVWLQSAVTSIQNKEGETQEFYIVLADITERKKTEGLLIEKADVSIEQNNYLQQFAYILSHNLRAPVASILGYANLLPLVKSDESAAAEILDKLVTSVKNIDDIIKDIYTIIRIKDHHELQGKEPVLISEIINQAINSLDKMLSDCNGKVLNNVNENVAVLGHRAYIYSIFYNIINNAIKYRSPEKALEIRINSLFSDGFLEVQIIDNGIGMEMEKVQDKIFQLYSRFNISVDGRGMGLYLVKTQIEALGGKVSFYSEPDKGTTFNLFFKQSNPE